MYLNKRKERLLIYEKEKELTVTINSAVWNIGDPNTDGSFRLIIVGGGLELQQRVAGVWTEGVDVIARWEQ